MQDQQQSSNKNLITLLSWNLVQPSQEFEDKLSTYTIANYIDLIVPIETPPDIKLAASSVINMKLLNMQQPLSLVQIGQTTRILYQAYIKLYSQRYQNSGKKIVAQFESCIQNFLKSCLDSQQKIMHISFYHNKSKELFEQIIKSSQNNCSSFIDELRLSNKQMCIAIQTLPENDLNNQRYSDLLIEVLLLLWQNMHKIFHNEQIRADQWRTILQITDQSLVTLNAISQTIELQVQNNTFENNQIQNSLVSNQVFKKFLTFLLQTVKDENLQTFHPTDIDLNSQSLKEHKTIFSDFQQIATLKAHVLQLWNELWIYCAVKKMFYLALFSIIHLDHNKIIDFNQSILEESVVLLQRSVTEQKFAPILFNCRDSLTMSLIKIIKANKPQRALLFREDEIESFLQIQQDFCTKQQAETLKNRVGSLLSTLCMTIDGYLTITVNICLLNLDQTLCNQAQSDFMKQHWPVSQQQRMQTCLIILACLSDQIQKRADLLAIVMKMIQHTQSKLKQSPQLLSKIPKIVLVRYVNLFAFNSFPNCLNVFFPILKNDRLFLSVIESAFKMILHYKGKDKKNVQMQQYIQYLIQTILFSSNQLTVLLQSTIVSNYELIVPIETTILQKLVVWLQQYYLKQNVIRCNKITYLLVILIDKFTIQKQENQRLVNFEVLSQYLNPLYKLLDSIQQHPAQQCLIEVAYTHLEKISKQGFRCDNEKVELLLRKMWGLCEKIIQRNGGIVTSCLTLTANILKMMPKIAKDVLNKEIQWVKNKQSIENGSNVWQWSVLFEFSVLTVSYQLNKSQTNLQTLQHEYQKYFQTVFEVAKKNGSILVVRRQLIHCLLAIFYMSIKTENVDRLYYMLRQITTFIFQKEREWITPYQLKIYAIYIVMLLPWARNAQLYVQLLKELQQLIKLLESKNYQQKYQQYIFCHDSKSNSFLNREKGIEMQAFMVMTPLHKFHPFLLHQVDIYQSIRDYWKKASKEVLKSNVLSEEMKQFLRNVLRKQTVTNLSRPIIKVKGIKVNNQEKKVQKAVLNYSSIQEEK